jgi:carboxyl-terminal processing protease
LDLRGNPGGLLDSAVGVCRLLTPEGPIVHTVDKTGVRYTYRSHLDQSPFDKMAVLIDNETASAAEIVASALQDANAAVVVGQQSYGKGVVQNLFTLWGDDGFKFTTMEYFRRSEEKINGVGVAPDIEVPMVWPLSDSIVSGELAETEWAPNLWDILRGLGYTAGSRDGAYYGEMRDAVIRFQTQNGLGDNGHLNLATIRALNEAYSAYSQRNDTGVQAALDALL